MVSKEIVSIILFCLMAAILLFVFLFTAGDAIMTYNEAAERDADYEYQRGLRMRREQEMRRQESFRMYDLTDHKTIKERKRA